jgi:FKBP-type peptidyl-prolyl cis-trans isomerase FkpA
MIAIRLFHKENTMKRLAFLALLTTGAIGLLSAGWSVAAGDKKEGGKVIESKSGLKYIEIKEGTGKEAKAGDTVAVHYTGWLKDGKKFDSSVDRKMPFEFDLGAGMVIKGWDEGVAGMKEGGKRKLIIPPELGYGDKGAGRGLIPPGAELHFEVELLKVK